MLQERLSDELFCDARILAVSRELFECGQAFSEAARSNVALETHQGRERLTTIGRVTVPICGWGRRFLTVCLELENPRDVESREKPPSDEKLAEPNVLAVRRQLSLPDDALLDLALGREPRLNDDLPKETAELRFGHRWPAALYTLSVEDLIDLDRRKETLSDQDLADPLRLRQDPLRFEGASHLLRGKQAALESDPAKEVVLQAPANIPDATLVLT